MTPTEATDLAKRIINTWHGGPRLDEWTDLLTDLDAGTAGTTFIRLRNEREHAPSIAVFLTKYRSLDTVTNRPVEARICHLCDNTGWISTDDLVTDSGHRYSQVVPCDHDYNHRPKLLDRNDPRAVAAFERGLTQGIAELDELRRRAGR